MEEVLLLGLRIHHQLQCQRHSSASWRPRICHAIALMTLQDPDPVSYARVNSWQFTLGGLRSCGRLLPVPGICGGLGAPGPRQETHGWAHQVEVLILLSCLAHGLSYRVVARAFVIPTTAVHRAVQPTCTAVLTLLDRVISFPKAEELPAVDAGFAHLATSPVFSGCVGAIDGSHVWVKVPPGANGQDTLTANCLPTSSYRPSVTTQVDSWTLMWGTLVKSMIRCPEESPVYLGALYPPSGYFIVADGGYPCISIPMAIMTSFPEPVQRRVQDRCLTAGDVLQPVGEHCDQVVVPPPGPVRNQTSGQPQWDSPARSLGKKYFCHRTGLWKNMQPIHCLCLLPLLLGSAIGECDNALECPKEFQAVYDKTVTEIPATLKPGATEVFFVGSKLFTIPNEAFIRNPKLEKLEFLDIPITSIDKGAFEALLTTPVLPPTLLAITPESAKTFPCSGGSAPQSAYTSESDARALHCRSLLLIYMPLLVVELCCMVVLTRFTYSLYCSLQQGERLYTRVNLTRFSYRKELILQPVHQTETEAL
ncbi:hypothetical protein AGOR_G00236740 [Albula goreensis]|uniref:DDE Tnp4 domain-containing protein n=1 Tax=Albula goreensis TaxID=1534307 RepID=A0A8T3CIV6_9TELE|nr:hypothetical protein AGOR_G00236740 [Albula goreensis]